MDLPEYSFNRSIWPKFRSKPGIEVVLGEHLYQGFMSLSLKI